MNGKIDRLFVLRSKENAAALYAFLKANWEALAGAGKPLMVQVSEYKTKRTREQNRRYWLLLEAIAAQAWVNGQRYSSACWHEYYKRKYIGVVDLPGGATMASSSTDLSVADFAEYMDKVEADAATELGVEFLA